MRPASLLLAALLLASCAGAPTPRCAEPPSATASTAATTETAPVAETASDPETDTDSDSDPASETETDTDTETASDPDSDTDADTAPPPLPRGRYWIRRVSRWGITRSAGYARVAGDTGPPVVTRTGSTECVALDVNGGAERRELRFRQTRMTYFPDRDGRWWIGHPSVRSTTRPMELWTRCEAPLHALSRSEEGVLPRSTGGLLFPDLGSCGEAPANYSQTCRGEECTYEDPRAAPFSFGECEAALAALGERVRRLEGSSHDASLRTAQRVTRMSRSGGRLYEPVEEVSRCEPVSVRPAEEGATRLSGTRPRADGGRVEWEVIARLLPLYHRTDHVSEGEAYYGPNGEVEGMSGSGSSFDVRGPPLRRRILLPGPAHPLPAPRRLPAGRLPRPGGLIRRPRPAPPLTGGGGSSRRWRPGASRRCPPSRRPGPDRSPPPR